MMKEIDKRVTFMNLFIKKLGLKYLLGVEVVRLKKYPHYSFKIGEKYMVKKSAF
ncbi:MAG: hypothetical protein ACTHK8_03235 [Ginsengibacter sp.]